MNWNPSTHHMPLNLLENDVSTGSRIGGTPPINIPSNLTCPVCQGKIEYILTLGEDALGEAAKNKELSFFVCEDFDCRWKSQRLIAPSSLIFLLHDACGRGKKGDMDSPSDGLGLKTGALTQDPTDEDGLVTTEKSKIGGGPGWIQSWGKNEGANIMKKGYMFLFQYEQPVYPDHKNSGADPFGFGAVYVFAKKNKNNLPDLSDVVGFWQKT
ncbi:MAG: hypothetical protein ACJ75J_13215 [Cytophagaceae bacterium]